MPEQIKRLTKADLLRSSEDVEYVYFEELGGELPLKPLTDGQWSRVKASIVGGMQASGVPGKDEKLAVDVNFDVGKIQEQIAKAHALAVSYGLALPEPMTPEEVEQMRPAGIVEKIANKIYDISGVDTPDSEVRSFRGVADGPGDSDLARLRSTSS